MLLLRFAPFRHSCRINCITRAGLPSNQSPTIWYSLNKMDIIFHFLLAETWDFDASLLDYADFLGSNVKMQEECLKRAEENVALLNIAIQTPHMTVTEGNIRINFADQLGIIGIVTF